MLNAKRLGETEFRLTLDLGVVFAFGGAQMAGASTGTDGAENAARILPGAINSMSLRFVVLHVGPVILMAMAPPRAAHSPLHSSLHSSLQSLVTFFSGIGTPYARGIIQAVALTAALGLVARHSIPTWP
ncbi:hypothetical protein J5X07_00430 [Actinomyces bowdenii]|uniref:hypothetical protein n=1 Tax=Actinomyces bowdenii TaxID=131109 RepID=UPI001ABCA608|nr:hypothetical protein [Actinomyces bowdenii]MBO3723509.1 hypothetical protein [Actinomyces bowdenii]